MEIYHAQAKVNVKSMGSSNINSFLLRKFMGRSVILRPGSKHLPALDMLSAVATTVGREVHVFVSPAALPLLDEGSSAGPQTDEESDEINEFTVEDYARIMAHKKQDGLLKTRKIREDEEAARRARITKATIRVQFPDNYVLEAVFQPADPVSMLFDLLHKAILQPNLAFYLYTAPPKQPITNLHQNMYAAGLTPGALVYFSYHSSKGQGNSEGPYLRPEIAALRDLHLLEAPLVYQDPTSQDVEVGSGSSGTGSVLEEKKESRRPSGKPKWFKQR